MGYTTLILMAFLSYSNQALLSSVNLFLMPCVMTFSLALGWRDGLVTMVLAIGALIMSYLTTAPGGAMDSTLEVMLGGMISAAIFGFTGPAVFRREMSQTIVAIKSDTEKAQSANEAKTRFIANMSHEIRTPLNGIVGGLQLLKKSDLSADQKELLRIVGVSADALSNLVTGVLDIAKVESGTLALDQHTFDLAKLVRETSDTVSVQASEKGLDLKVDISVKGSAFVNGDKNRLAQVLINLLGNAIKFTPAGGVTLTLMQKDSSLYHFSVADTGPGIAAEKQDVIFERFGQAEEGVGLGSGGTGLGLAISQEIITLMGGRIEVESNPGQGARFYFDLALPLGDPAKTAKAASEPTEAARSGEEDSPSQSTKAILLAEDNKINQLIIEKIFATRSDYGLTCVENGQKALDYLAANPCDLVLMDVNMPVMNGDDATRMIRHSGTSYADLPIVMLTANTLAEQKEKSLESGANAFLTKPINIETLWQTLDELLCEN